MPYMIVDKKLVNNYAPDFVEEANKKAWVFEIMDYRPSNDVHKLVSESKERIYWNHRISITDKIVNEHPFDEFEKLFEI